VITRAKTCTNYINDSTLIYNHIKLLFTKEFNKGGLIRGRSVRLLGIRVGNFKGQQKDLEKGQQKLSSSYFVPSPMKPSNSGTLDGVVDGDGGGRGGGSGGGNTNTTDSKTSRLPSLFSCSSSSSSSSSSASSASASASASSPTSSNKRPHPDAVVNWNDVDASVLAALPKHIQAELQHAYNPRKKKTTHKQTLFTFFGKK
jgi:hypothetical protein